MKKALQDLGVQESELKEPPLSKTSYLEKLRKQTVHNEEVEKVFREKFGIKKADLIKTPENREKLKEKAKNITKELDRITDEEQKLIDQTKIEYDGSVEYEEYKPEDYEEHVEQSYKSIQARLRELKEQGIIEENLEEKKREEDEGLEKAYYKNKGVISDRKEVETAYNMEVKERR